MKKTFEFGKIDYTGNGRKSNLIKIDIELREKEKGAEFTASGEIWQANMRDILSGGQNLDEINKHLKGNKLFNKIYKFWKAYHLNGMHPECIHQNKLGWMEQASEEIKISKYTMTIDTITLQSKTQSNILKRIKEGKAVKPTSKQVKILNLDYSIEIEEGSEDQKELIQTFYKFKETKTERAGWTREETNKRGLLGKACPVCGYKYGSSWKHHKITANDIKQIKKLLEV